MSTRYVLTATLARAADGGAGLGLVLLALAPTSALARPGVTGGLLVAGLSAPHVLGPFVARILDAAADGRRVLALGFTVYGFALGVGALLLGHTTMVVVGMCVVLAGLCGPLLTGGLSSRLSGIVASDSASQRRAQGWDSMTYGLGGTAGPAAVAGLAALAGPPTALLVLACSALVAAVLALTLPAEPHTTADRPVAMTVRAALASIVAHGPLRRVTYATLLTAIAMGSLSLLAVQRGTSLSSWSSAGAVLAAMFGVGNLVGSLGVTVRPLRGEPERLTAGFTVALAVAYAACACAPTYPLALAAFTLAGVVNAPFFTAILAARSEYAPPSARAQIFVSMAGLKVACSATGAALAGVALGVGARTLLAAAALLTLGAAISMLVDRRATARHGAPTGADALVR